MAVHLCCMQFWSLLFIHVLTIGSWLSGSSKEWQSFEEIFGRVLYTNKYTLDEICNKEPNKRITDMQETNISNLENADFKKGISKPWDNCLFVTITKQLKLMCDKAD